MTLIASVSGIRGTIGGPSRLNLCPPDIVRFTTAYACLLLEKKTRPLVVVGRDGRISGDLVSNLVTASLQAMGVDVIQAGLSTTPTIEMAVVDQKADGGIILTASHNPKEWNALKLLNEKGEFISQETGIRLLALSQKEDQVYASIDRIGRVTHDADAIERHVQHILNLSFVQLDAIRKKKFKVAADCINSTGALALPVLFDALGVEYQLLHAEMTGDFAHNPEPLPAHLGDLMQVCRQGFDLGIAVDPDVDRLALVDERGEYFGEEYTLVAVADYVLGLKKGDTVSNLSSSRALRDITIAHGGRYFASAVGEVHVVQKMKSVNAVIGGEGNGGVIVPDLHYGRDALAGIALILSLLASRNTTLSALRKSYPQYHMYKDKIVLREGTDYEDLLGALKQAWPQAVCNMEDGLKMDFENSWLHLRKSNTEPVVRIYSEAGSVEEARSMCEQIKLQIEQF